MRQDRSFRLTRHEEISVLFSGTPPLEQALRSEEAQRLYDDVLEVFAD